VGGDASAGREAERAGVAGQVGRRDAEIGRDVVERTVFVLVLLAKPVGVECYYEWLGPGTHHVRCETRS
jgi:hypothetical protein